MKLYLFFICNLFFHFGFTQVSGEIQIEFIDIPGGSFLMGSPLDEVGREVDELEHYVTLSPFQMSKNRITFDQYDAFCKATGHKKPSDFIFVNGVGMTEFKTCRLRRGDNSVVNINWEDANTFAKWLGCRLPTEAEWEYVCKKVKAVTYSDDINTLGLLNFDNRISEWCSDWYGEYKSGQQLNPQGAEPDAHVVMRGSNRCAARLHYFETYKYEDLGLRLVRDVNLGTKLVSKKIPIRIDEDRSQTVLKSIQFIDVPKGNFMMGSSVDEMGHFDNETQHKVGVSAFRMSKFEITFDQYDAFCEATGRVKPEANGDRSGSLPVVNVKWDDAVEFCEWIDCRLPTEAEWEYACRAGSQTPFNTGYELNSELANTDGVFENTYPEEYQGSYLGNLHNVGSYPPNKWGFYDMHGNVWEYCLDNFGDYSVEYQLDPLNQDYSDQKVIRGGAYGYNTRYCRSAYREAFKSQSYGFTIGFRVVMPLECK
jgi:formylglycine-generating enzyme required for sulfatase activity